jgi:hypothetical protein
MAHKRGELMDGQSLMSMPLKQVLDVMMAAPRKVLSEYDFIRAALDFANTGSFRALAMQVSGIPVPNGPVDDPGWQKNDDRIAREQYAADCEQFRTDLVRVLSKSSDAGFIARLDAGARIGKLPQRKGKSRGDHYIVDGVSAATNHAVILLLDPALPYGKDLHRCQWHECAKFFLTSDAQKQKDRPTGLPRTKYCSDECMFKTRAQRRRNPKPKRKVKS